VLMSRAPNRQAVTHRRRPMMDSALFLIFFPVLFAKRIADDRRRTTDDGQQRFPAIVGRPWFIVSSYVSK